MGYRKTPIRLCQNCNERMISDDNRRRYCRKCGYIMSKRSCTISFLDHEYKNLSDENKRDIVKRVLMDYILP